MGKAPTRAETLRLCASLAQCRLLVSNTPKSGLLPRLRLNIDAEDVAFALRCRGGVAPLDEAAVGAYCADDLLESLDAPRTTGVRVLEGPAASTWPALASEAARSSQPPIAALSSSGRPGASAHVGGPRRKE